MKFHSTSFDGIGRILIAAGIVWSVALPALAAADTPPVAGMATAAKPGLDPVASAGDTAGAYTLAADDQVSVTVINCPQLNTQVVVTPDGNIDLPLIHTVAAAGLTPSQLGTKLTKLWSTYVIRPSVNVSVTQKHRQLVSVSGFVLRPGSIECRGNMRVLDIIADAGGFNLDSDQTQVSVTRKNGEKQVLDLSHPGTKAGTELDVPVYEGDSIFVPEASAKISVVGQVRTPGSYPYREPMKVLDAIGAAGGVIIDDADLKKATLTHNGADVPLDLDALLKKGDLSANVTLAQGDRILIPQPIRCYVFGAVLRPGFYVAKDGDRLLDAINACGGTSPEASLRSVRLVRIAKDKNTATSLPINLENFFKKGDMTNDPEIQAGDAIYVDLKSTNQKANNIYGLLSGLNLLNLGARIITGGLGK